MESEKPVDEALAPRKRRRAADLNTLMREMDVLATTAREIVNALPRRWKGDLSNPTGWRTLQQATYSDAFARHLTPDAISKLRSACAAWSYRFTQLRFLTTTRPVWNT